MVFPPTSRFAPAADAPLSTVGLRPGARRSRTALAGGAALVLALGAVGCGGGDDDEPTTNTAAAAGAAGAGTSTTPTTNAAPAAEQAAPADAPKAIATREGSVDGDPVTAELLELKRSGPTLVLSLRLRVAGQGSELNAQVGSALANDTFERSPDDRSLPSDNADGITLVDTKNRKRHLVARDANRGCVCSTELNSVFVRAASPVNLSATFGAPPADVRTMDVSIPQFGTFTGVPVS